MAFDFIRGRMDKTDWSCGLDETSPPFQASSRNETIAKVATIGVVAIAGIVLASQPSAKDIQRGHYEREFGRRGHV